MLPAAAVEATAPASINVLKSRDAWRIMSACDDERVLQQWHQFGTLLLEEVQARTAALDSKAGNLVGWSVATATAGLALLRGEHAPYGYFVLCVAVTAASLGAWALKVGSAFVPSQMDWFAHEQCADAKALMRFHLLSMRDWHEHDSELNRQKGARLVWAQGALCAAVAALLVLLIVAR